MKQLPRLLLLGTLAAAMTASGATYARKEKDGSMTYSDRPIPGGTLVELQPAQSYSAPPPPPSTRSSVPSEQRLLQEMDSFTYQSCSLSPASDATFTNPESVPIAVVTSPSLRSTDVVSMVVDGQSVAAPAGTFTLAPAYRGTHTVQVTVSDRFGRQLCSATTSFHIMRPSLNSPRR